MPKTPRIIAMLGIMMSILFQVSSVHACPTCVMILSYDLLRFFLIWIVVFIIWAILAFVAGITPEQGHEKHSVFVFAKKPLLLVLFIMLLLTLLGMGFYAVLLFPFYLLPYLVKPEMLRSRSAIHRSRIAPKWFRTASIIVLIIMLGSILPSYYIFPFVYSEVHIHELVMKTRSNLNTLATLIEKHREQYGAYPNSAVMQSDYATYNTIDIDALKRVARDSSDRDLARIMEDSFSVVNPTNFLPYKRHNRFKERLRYSSTVDRYVLWSAGPDGMYEQRLPGVAVEDTFSTAPEHEPLLNITHDPTNGTISPGDIYILGSR